VIPPVADWLRGALADHSAIALPLALVGGLFSALNPCCLPLYPAAVATCCAAREPKFQRTAMNAVAFVVGVAFATTLLGVAAALLGRTMIGLGGWARVAIAVIPLVMGLQLLHWIQLPLPSISLRGGRPGLGGSFVTGLLLSLALAPCGTPVLASVLSYAAYQGSVPFGATLLFLYGIGAGIPMIAVGTVAGGLASRLAASRWQPWVDRGTGVLLLGVGFHLLWTAW